MPCIWDITVAPGTMQCCWVPGAADIGVEAEAEAEAVVALRSHVPDGHGITLASSSPFVYVHL